MLAYKPVIIVEVPKRDEPCTYMGALPLDGSLWGRVSGNPQEALERVQQHGLPFGKVIYTLEPLVQETAGQFSREVITLFLEQAVELFDLVELQFGRDTTATNLQILPWSNRVLTANVTNYTSLETLEALFWEMSAIKACYYTITVQAVESGDELPVLALLKKLDRKDLIAYAVGPLGAWTRLVAPSLGSPAVFATLTDNPVSDGAFPVQKLLSDYGLSEVPRFQDLYGIAGKPVFSSLSPKLHNAAYLAQNIPAFFVPFHIDDYDTFHRQVVQSPMLALLGFEIKGLTVVSPFKEAGYRLADKVVHTVSAITQSSNLLAKRGNGWIADSTDPLAIMEALERLEVDPHQLRAAVVGCGGAGRAIAATLLDAGAQVILFNRTSERGEMASRQLNIPFDLLENLAPESFDILVNATPLGKRPHERPFDPERLNNNAVFIDYAYGKHTSSVIGSLRNRGVGCVDGREVLIIQVRRQFEVMTGEIMPEKLAIHQVFELEMEYLLT